MATATANKTTARKLPVRKPKPAAETPAPAPAPEEEVWVIWDNETTLTAAYAKLKECYARLHGKTSNHYKALLRREVWWANAGTRWYIAFEGVDGKIWFFGRNGKMTNTYDEWPDKYDYYDGVVN